VKRTVETKRRVEERERERERGVNSEHDEKRRGSRDRRCGQNKGKENDEGSGIERSTSTDN